MKGILAAAVAATLLAGCAGMMDRSSGQPGAAGAPRSAADMVDDATITSQVRSQLAADPELSGFKIDVASTQGAVRLRGEIKTLALRRKAETVARGVRGVRSVNNELVITG